MKYIPYPVFDTLQEVIDLHQDVYNAKHPYQIIEQWLADCFNDSKISPPEYAAEDFMQVLKFIYSYRGSKDTFGAYRRELERLLQWSWFIQNKSLMQLTRDDVEAFIGFCLKPPKAWIGLKKVARFKLKSGIKARNPEWRPFEARISKKQRATGQLPTVNDYEFSQAGLKALFAIVSSFYNYCLQEELVNANPVALIRQKSKFIRKDATQKVIRRLSTAQWQLVIQIAKDAAAQDENEERSVFILSCLYGMYLRISELVSSQRWHPTMNDFFRDVEGNWWFKTVGKGNKLRQIAVSEAMLAALKHYRTHYLKTTPYPTPDENMPLISHLKNPHQAIASDYPVRKLVQLYFDKAADILQSEGKTLDADNLRTATVHWLRHTGISEDVQVRPREHVRDDAGHSSGAITDKYIDVQMRERAASAKDKPLE